MIKKNPDKLEALTDDEERALLARIKAKDLEARITLTLHNLGLVHHVANKYETSEVKFNELSAFGIKGIDKAIDTCCENENIPFTDHALRCIEEEILIHLQERCAKKRH